MHMQTFNRHDVPMAIPHGHVRTDSEHQSFSAAIALKHQNQNQQPCVQSRAEIGTQSASFLAAFRALVSSDLSGCKGFGWGWGTSSS